MGVKRGLAVWGLGCLTACTPVEATLPLVHLPDPMVAQMALEPDELQAWHLSRGCQLGVYEDCHALGGLYFVGQGVPRIVAHAISLWTHACDRGLPQACSELARQYEWGGALDQDLDLALEARERACRLGQAADCTRVGAYHLDGRLGSVRARRAVRWFRRGCEGGDAQGCHELALATIAGNGTGRDPAHGVELLQTECASAHAPSCTQLSVLFDEGRVVVADGEAAGRYRARACAAGAGQMCTALGVDVLSRDPDAVELAADRFTQACELGDTQGCALLGRAYDLGQGRPLDPHRAFELYSSACAEGAAEACGRAMVLGESASIDAGQLRGFYQLACDDGYMDACHFLAGLHLDGVGGPVDPQMAALLYERACDARVAVSCIEFAFMAAATEYARPFGWLQRACEVDSAACAVLGEIHEGGFWGEPRPELAASLYQRACAQDSPRACFRLGTLHYRGEGVQQDLGAAARLMSVACDGDQADACATLAHMHERGMGVATDSAIAAEYRKRACRLGEEASCRWGDGHSSEPPPAEPEHPLRAIPASVR